jgi:hypothetical protein
MMQRSTLDVLYGLTALLALAGCSGSFYARSPDDYRTATRTLLESKESSFKDCYQGVLTSTPDAAGTVAVSFVVEEKTGKILKPASLPASTAPEPLRECVVKGLDGLALDPPDQRKGMATMTFDFARG